MLNINSFKFTLVLAVLLVFSIFLPVPGFFTPARLSSVLGVVFMIVPVFTIGALVAAAIIWGFARKKLAFPVIWNVALLTYMVSLIVTNITLLVALIFM